ncbi:hypothetical protein CC79DRAFT_1385944 [Sarocladium strictum]
MATQQSHARHILITQPRTASHLLVKILNLEGQNARIVPDYGYFFLPLHQKRYAIHDRLMKDWTEEETKNILAVAQECFDNLQQYAEDAEKEGQLAVFKEHSLLMTHPFFHAEQIHGEGTMVDEPTPLVGRDGATGTRSKFNKTCLSDEFLLTWRPTFLIRHPAMVITSMYRAAIHAGFKRESNEPHVSERTYFWTRSLYDFYASSSDTDSPFPIILDADDIMTSPELMTAYSRTAGFNPDQLRFQWDKVSDEALAEMSQIRRHMQSSLHASSGINMSKIAGDLDIDKEAAEWRKEFGEEGGRNLEGWVRAAMPDYEYLRERRFRLD